MKKLDAYQFSLYAFAGILSVSGAFLISLRFVGKTRAQDQAQPIQQMEAPANSPEGVPVPPPQPQPAQSENQPMPGQPGLPGQHMPGENPNGVTSPDISGLEGFLEPFIYDVVNRRDPFMPWAEYVPIETLARPASPAQRYDLEQLKLVGIMWDVKDPKAMFMDPESEVIVLGRDEGIGNKNGYIASIREGEVVVVEATRKRGDIIYKTRTLRIER